MDKILDIFLDEPEKEFHVRQISKIVKKSPTTVSKYLKAYEKEGILRVEGKFNHLFFRANSESLNFKQLKKNKNILQIYNSGIINYLEAKLNHPEAIVLFGSFAKGDSIKKSDIDLFIISPSKKEIDVSEYEKILNHPIQMQVYSKKEIENLKLKNKELLNNIANGIILYGYWEMF